MRLRRDCINQKKLPVSESNRTHTD